MGRNYTEGYSRKIKNIEIIIKEGYVFIDVEDNSTEPELIDIDTNPIAYPCQKLNLVKNQVY
jgi:hypothetical protein